jgi:two-component sensor histidine kinase
MVPPEVGTFDIAPFLQDLCAAILEHGAGWNIRLLVDAGHRKVTLDYIVLVGLLVTELLTNCLRHASKGGNGRITVTSSGDKGTSITLIVSNEDSRPADPAMAASFAAEIETRLVTDLVNQLGAALEIHAENGLKVKVEIIDRT